MAGLASRLSDRGHSVTLVTLDDGQQDRHDVAESVRRQPLDQMGTTRGLFEKIAATKAREAAVRDAIEAIGPDVVLSFCDRTNILTLQALARSRFPVVVSERSDPVRQNLGAFWEFQRRRCYRRAARIVALTEHAAGALAPMNRYKVAVIPSSVDVPPMRSDRVAAQANRLVVGVGRLEREKGFDRLVRAFADARPSADWTLRILGEGSQRESLLTLAAEFGVANRLELPGWVRPVWPELGKATCFVLPSRYEGFPSALLEAMSMGVPSLAVDCECGGPRAIIGDQQGLLVDRSDAALTDGLRRIMTDEPSRERWGEGGMSVVDRFGWEPMVNAYEALLKEVAGSGSST